MTEDVLLSVYDFRRLAGHLFIRGIREHGDPGYRAYVISTDPSPDPQMLRGEPRYFLGLYVFWNVVAAAEDKSPLEQRVEKKLEELKGEKKAEEKEEEHVGVEEEGEEEVVA